MKMTSVDKIKEALEILSYKAFGGDRFKCELAQDDMLSLTKTINALDTEAVKLLRQALLAPHPNAVLFALLLFDKLGIDPGLVYFESGNLLMNSSPFVRKMALKHIKQSKINSEVIRSQLAKMATNSREHCGMRIVAFRLLADRIGGFVKAVKLLNVAQREKRGRS